MKLEQLSTSEKIFLAEQLWESARSDANQHALSDIQKSELDYRLAAFELDKEAGESWESIKKRILSV